MLKRCCSSTHGALLHVRADERVEDVLIARLEGSEEGVLFQVAGNTPVGRYGPDGVIVSSHPTDHASRMRPPTSANALGAVGKHEEGFLPETSKRTADENFLGSNEGRLGTSWEPYRRSEFGRLSDSVARGRHVAI